MTTIRPSDLRNMIQRLAQDGTIDKGDVDQLVDAAMQDGVLSISEQQELRALLVEHVDKLDSPETKQRVQSFLAMTDGRVRNLAHMLEKQDGVLDIADADKLAELVQADGKIDGHEKFSLRAVMLGSKLTAPARDRLAALADGAVDTPPAEVAKTATPNLAIPDSDTAGVADTLSFAGDGRVGEVRVELDLEHTYRGDLDISLVAPDGTEVKLHDRSGGSADDLVGVYPRDLEPAGSLDALKGKPIAGDWTLKVRDLAGQDVGTLRAWKLAFTEATDQPTPVDTVKKTSTPNVDIPDNDAAGVADRLQLDGAGEIESLKIHLDLEHTYRGDLKVTLVAPDGTEVKLHNRGGGSGDHLKGTYPGSLAPAESLDKLKGKPFAGEWQLKVSDLAGRDLGTLKSWGLEVTPKSGGGGGGGDPIALGTTDADLPVFLSPSGFFVEDRGTDRPRDNLELGSGLYRMADVVDDARSNPFSSNDIPLAARQKALANLQEALAKVPADGPPPAGLDERQALQLRSCAVTVLRELMLAAEGTGDEGALKRQAFDAYAAALGAETHPMLRDSMIFNLHAARDKLTSEMQQVADRLYEQIAPTKPPYEDWFKDGNRTLNISWTCGLGDEGFYRGTVAMLKSKGFAAEGTEREGGPCWYAKKMTGANGEEYTVRIKVKENRSNNIFEDMDDDSFHIVGYDGHSNFGRNIPDSLRGAPDGAGKKLIFYGLCAGKDNIHRVREKYPDSQVLTTFTSSYFNTTEVDGRKQMNRSENFNVLMTLMEDSVKQKEWTDINTDIREKAILFPWSHVMPGGGNYVSPIHTEIRRRVLDSDHDGQADYLDKLIDVNPFKVAEETRREFTPVDPGRPAQQLDGTRVHIAAMGLNTETGYNQVTKDYKKGNIIGNGYFEPQPGERAIVKFERDQIDGEPVLHMSVNKNYAHMSADALRAVASYQFIQEIAPHVSYPRMDDVDRKLMGLTFATASIAYDTGWWSRDNEIWAGLLAAFNLPTDMPFSPIKALIDDEHHDYTGNMTHVSKYKDELSDAIKQALKRGDVGVP